MTFLEDLEHVAAEVRRKSSKDLPHPIGPFVIRCRPPQDSDARDRLTPIVAAYRRGGALTRDQELQLLVDCCEQILKRTPDGELVPYEDEGEEPLRFDAGDERWGGDVTSARDCVAKFYNLDERPLALAGTADNLVDWLQGMDDDVEDAVRAEGKPQAAPS